MEKSVVHLFIVLFSSSIFHSGEGSSLTNQRIHFYREVMRLLQRVSWCATETLIQVGIHSEITH